MYDPRHINELLVMASNKELDLSSDVVWLRSTGYLDIDGTEIFEKDLVNICYTRESGLWLTDALYEVSICPFRGLVFRYKRLLWENHGYNQIPWEMDLHSGGILERGWCDKKNKPELYIRDQYTRDLPPQNIYPFNEINNPFGSRYIKIVGNSLTHPEL